MRQGVSIAWLSALSCTLAFTGNTPVGATVKTTSGDVTGHAARNKTEVSEYLGIPYAMPPVGNLRFAAPEMYSSSKAFDGSSYSPDCPQMGLKAPPIKYPGQTPQFASIVEAFAGGRGNAQSEDCLTLNIWTKNPSCNETKAVLLWIHGGKFTLGDTNTPFYQGQYLVDSQDIVFVSINYRTNIFGFSGAPGQPQNVGLLDQRMAIRWVETNIAGFGGDPERITIMGQSAGGSAVDYYAYAYVDEPIVAGLISHSGTAFSFNPNTPVFSQNSFMMAASSLGCSGSNVVECMREQDFTAVLNSTAKVKPLPSNALVQPAFHPTIDNKTVFSLEEYRTRGRQGNFAKIPYLAGNNDKEDGWYHLAAAGLNINLTADQWDLFDLEGFTCATRDATSVRVKADVPVWRYRYFGSWANLELYPGSGAYHGSDLHMIFGGAEDVTGLPNSPAEAQTMEYMMRAWGAFVKDPENGLSDAMGWPTQGTTLVELAWKDNPQPTFTSPGIFDGDCPGNGSVAEAQGAF